MITKILIVEDEPINAELLGEMVRSYFEAMESSEFEIDFAKDGLEAVALYEKSGHDVIFMDIMMPKMDGFEATRNIRLCNNIQKDPTILMLTSLNDKESIAKGFISGANWYVAKPYDINELELLFNDIMAEKPYTKLYVESLVDKKITAEEFMDSFFLEFSVHKLEYYNEILLENLNTFSSEKDYMALKNMSATFKDYSNFLESTKEFKKISLALFDLSELFGDIDTLENEEFFIEFSYSLLSDLEKWSRNIFLDKIAIDIHYLDDSLISSILQLKQIIKPIQIFEEEEIEFF